jgi:drug/metabolite transporter (DMT)-like permease
VILLLRGRRPEGDWLSGLALFLYAAPFSFAYVSLGVGTGALLAFGAVQLTMLTAGIRQGERPPATEWWGILAAVGGLVYLVSPGLRAPSFAGSVLMIVAGVAWGIYSLRGRRAAHPVAATAGNFLRALPFTLLVSLAFLHQADLSPGGAILAIVSGALTSGVGYVIWYAALRGLTATRAAAAQLATPALAALGGVLFLGEPISARLVIAGAFILGGVALALRRR